MSNGSGQAETVAETREDFQRTLDESELADSLLLLGVVEEFEALNGPLRPRECLGFTTLPILGGSYTVGNRFRLPVSEHAAVTGEMHRQLRDLPDGTQITVKITSVDSLTNAEAGAYDSYDHLVAMRSFRRGGSTMRSTQLAATVLLLVVACSRQHASPQQVAMQTRTVSTAQMDSATIERLCVHPDSVRAGRADCVLKDQSAEREQRLRPVTPP